jgi:hypothetical protein
MQFVGIAHTCYILWDSFVAKFQSSFSSALPNIYFPQHILTADLLSFALLICRYFKVINFYI